MSHTLVQLMDIIAKGNMQELQGALQNSHDQEVHNHLLVRSLLSGQKNMFDYMLNSADPSADMKALSNENITQYLTASDFNIAEPPFDSILNGNKSKEDRLKDSKAIITEIAKGQDGEYRDCLFEAKSINIPAMAIFFKHEELLSRLINEKWDFNQTIGQRPVSPLALAISLDNDPDYLKIATKLITRAAEARIDIGNQDLRLASCFAAGQFNKAYSYITAIGETPLKLSEIKELIDVMPFASAQSEGMTAEGFVPVLTKLRDKISKQGLKEATDLLDSIEASIKRKTMDPSIAETFNITPKLVPQLVEAYDLLLPDFEGTSLEGRRSEVHSSISTSCDSISRSATPSTPSPSKQSFTPLAPIPDNSPERTKNGLLTPKATHTPLSFTERFFRAAKSPTPPESVKTSPSSQRGSP